MAGEKILIVDDRRENIVFLANDIFRPAGYQVITAMDGERGLQKALQENPDLIITDMQMPRMTGDEMIHALREAGHTIPVILTTFHGSESAAIRAFRAGATDYLIKPFTVDEILEAVKRALSPRAVPPAPSADVEPQEPAQVPSTQTTQKLLERRMAELSTLHDIGKAITSFLDLEQILSRAVEAAVYLSNAREGHLLLVEPSTGELYMRAVYNHRDKHARSVRSRVGDSLTRQVVNTGKPIILKPPFSGDAEHEQKTDHRPKSMLAVPIKRTKKVIGVLLTDNVIKQAEFTEKDSRQLSILADYVAIAIANGQLYRQAQERAEALARLLEERPAGTPGHKDRVEVVSEEAPRLTEADIADCCAEAARLADQLRTLADKTTKLGQRLQATISASDRPQE